MSRPTYGEASDWLDNNPNGSAHELAEAVGCARSTAFRWRAKWLKEQGVTPLPGGPTKKPRNPAAGRTPAAELPPDDRAEAVALARGFRRVMGKLLAQIEAVVDSTTEGDLPPWEVDRLASAAQKLGKAAEGTCDLHPGLMGLVNEGEAPVREWADTDAELAIEAMIAVEDREEDGP